MKEGQKSIQAEKEEEGKTVDKRTKGDDQEENEGGKDSIKFRRKFKRPIKKFIFDKRNSKEAKRKGG